MANERGRGRDGSEDFYRLSIIGKGNIYWKIMEVLKLIIAQGIDEFIMYPSGAIFRIKYFVFW